MAASGGRVAQRREPPLHADDVDRRRAGREACRPRGQPDRLAQDVLAERSAYDEVGAEETRALGTVDVDQHPLDARDIREGVDDLRCAGEPQRDVGGGRSARHSGELERRRPIGHAEGFHRDPRRDRRLDAALALHVIRPREQPIEGIPGDRLGAVRKDAPFNRRELLTLHEFTRTVCDGGCGAGAGGSGRCRCGGSAATAFERYAHPVSAAADTTAETSTATQRILSITARIAPYGANRYGALTSH